MFGNFFFDNRDLGACSWIQNEEQIDGDSDQNPVFQTEEEATEQSAQEWNEIHFCKK
jgi:hypothetical protein